MYDARHATVSLPAMRLDTGREGPYPYRFLHEFAEFYGNHDACGLSLMVTSVKSSAAYNVAENKIIPKKSTAYRTVSPS